MWFTSAERNAHLKEKINTVLFFLQNYHQLMMSGPASRSRSRSRASRDREVLERERKRSRSRSVESDRETTAAHSRRRDNYSSTDSSGEEDTRTRESKNRSRKLRRVDLSNPLSMYQRQTSHKAGPWRLRLVFRILQFTHFLIDFL